MSQCNLRLCLVAVFALFAFVALVFEPLYYYGCQWNIEQCLQSTSPVLQTTAQIWQIYAVWDPLFDTPTDWLRVMCNIEVFAFGPLYLATCALPQLCVFFLKN